MPKSKKKVNKSSNSVKKEVKVENKEVKNTTSAKKTTSKPKAKNSVKTQDKNKRWFKEFKAELKKIIWPSKRELLENSVVVISMVLIVAGIIFVLDLAFRSLNSVEIEAAKKAKESITVKSEVNATDDENENKQVNETVNVNEISSDEPTTEIDVSNEAIVNNVEAIWTEDATNDDE